MSFAFDRQRRPVTPLAARVRRRCTRTWGLRGVDLTVGPGEGVALVGPNGAGKTTLLRVLAGVLPADEGTVEVQGRTGPLLVVDAGLTPVLTGRENALLLGVLSGLSRARAGELVDGLRARGVLGESFERPVSSYSHGMRARLGLAMLEESEPDVLLLDEVQEALDADARAVLERRAASIRASGGIVVAAGHDRDALARLCDRELALDQGTVGEARRLTVVA